MVPISGTSAKRLILKTGAGEVTHVQLLPAAATFYWQQFRISDGGKHI